MFCARAKWLGSHGARVEKEDGRGGARNALNRVAMSGERLNVFATRMTLTMMKNRAKGAKAGHKLLKRKADALTMKFRSMAKVIKDVRHTRAPSSGLALATAPRLLR